MFNILKMLLGGSKRPSRSQNDGAQENTWLSWKAHDHPPTAPDGFVKLTGATDVAIAGTSYRLEDCKIAISALKGGRVDAASIDLVREGNNVEHPNAVGVFVKLRHRECHIGYLPRDVADMIAHDFSADMPLKAALREWGQ
ncbi:MAG: HIRAN domain-containing protein, partial [Tabrizicola sp.]